MADGQVRITVESNARSTAGDFDRLDRSINQVVDELRDVNSRAQQTETRFGTLRNAVRGVVGVLAFREIVQGGRNLINLASDAEETANRFNVVFSGIQEQAQETANRITRSYGLAQQETEALLSNTGDLLTGFNFTQQEALSLSTSINELAVDLASFTNIEGGAERASAALTSALLGEREAVKSLGISITQADIERLAEDQGIVGELTRQQEAVLTLQLALSQSRNAIGDFQRSQSSFANQTRILRGTFIDLRTELGEVLLPTFTEFINELNDFASSSSDNVVNAFRVIVDSIALFKDSLDIALQAIRNLVSTGEVLLRGFALAVRGRFEDASSAIQETFSQLREDTQSDIEEIRRSFDTLFGDTERPRSVVVDITAQANQESLQSANDEIRSSAESNIREISEEGRIVSSNVASSLSGALTTPFEEGETAAQRFGQVAINIIQQVAQEILSRQIASSVAGLFPAAGGGAAGAAGTAASVVASAKGNVFKAGNVEKFARGGAFTNGIVSRPTTFPMSDGRTGLMGEAGAEAIVPLTRTRGGDLGIRAEGIGGQSTVNVFNQAGAEIETVSRPNNETDIFIRRVNGAMASDRTLQSFQSQLDKTNRAGAQAI